MAIQPPPIEQPAGWLGGERWYSPSPSCAYDPSHPLCQIWANTEDTAQFLTARVTGLYNIWPGGTPWWFRCLPFVLLFWLFKSWQNNGWLWRKLSGFRLSSGQYVTSWASAKDLDAAGLFRPNGRFLGVFRGRDMFLTGEGHSLTMGAPGGGKTSGVIIPTLLTYKRGVVIVTDPKGSITAQTRRFRETVGPVFVLNPWHHELKPQGIDLGDDGLNPMFGADGSPAGTSIRQAVSAALVPSDQEDRSRNFFPKEARMLLEWGMLYLALHGPPETRNFPTLRRLLYDVGKLVEVMQQVAASDIKGPGWETLKDDARRFVGTLSLGAGEQIAGAASTASSALSIYSVDSELGHHVTFDGLHLADLKAGQPMTIYLVCPPNHLVNDNREWMNLVMRLILEKVGAAGRGSETVLLMDEFPAFGRLDNLASSLEQFRQQGLRAHLIAQNMGQILRSYGADGFQSILETCSTIQVFSLASRRMAEEVSAMCGSQDKMSFSVNPEGQMSASAHSVPLISSEEIMGLGEGRQIILNMRVRKPVMANLVRWFDRKEWGGLVDPDPTLQGQ